ncbi:MAG TPA: type II secretion system secretin GspD [Xanthobacteraceae bacterium]|nr:type II secretion system secretin GspD [Xanthobacteraceae bacterium]
MGLLRGRRMGRRVAWSFCVVLAGSILAACSIGGFDPRPDPRDNHPPDVMDHVRSLDLLPRFPKNSDAAPTPNTASSARPTVFPGPGEVTVAQPQTRDAAPNGDGYDLNFENAPVATVAKVILGDILGVGYTIDPRVQGTVTLASGRPVAKSDILYVLENALRLSNVALVRDRTGYRLMPAGDAVGAGPMDRLATAQPGYGITVIPLRYVSAQTIIKLVDGFASKPGQIRADAARNLLMLQGSGAERRNALEIVGSFDVDWMRGQSVGVYPVHNSTPEPIIAELEKIMDSGDSGLGHDMVKFQPVARMNAILVVSRKPEFLRAAGTWISRLDQSDTAATNLRVYRLHYGDARHVASLLSEIFLGRASSGLNSANSQIAPGAGLNASTSGPLAALSALPQSPSSATSTTTTTTATSTRATTPGPGLDTARGNNPQSGIFAGGNDTGTGTSNGPGIMPNVRITADVTNNSILVYADRDAQRIVEQTLRQIDRPLLQVAIDATIAEVTLNDQLTYGVQFYLKDHPDHGSIINSIGGAVIAQQLPGFNFLVGSAATPNVILNALHNVTDVRVLSNPSLVVLDNQTATLQVGDQVPISTGSATVLTANNTVVNTIDYKNTGIILRVVPRVNPNGNVVLDIEQEISSVVPGSAALTPTVSERKVKSSIAVQSGQTVLLAGLISDSVNVTKQGIPLLDEIPKIGDAFANQTKTNVRTELIIFIRPQIIRDAVDANMVAEELRTKMNDRLIGSNNHMPNHGTVEGPTPPLFH